jgi:hypothetical protein
MQDGVISSRSPQHVQAEVWHAYGTRGSGLGWFWKCGTHRRFFNCFIQVDAVVPMREYGIVTEQARLVKTVKVILGLAFIIRYDQTVGVAMG